MPTNNIITHWIKDQDNFFKSRINSLDKKIKICKYLSWTFLLMGLLTMIPLFVISFSKINCFSIERLKWVTTAMGLFFSVGASAKAYSEKRGFHQIINQYVLMKSIYEKSADKIEHIMSMSYSPDEKKAAIKKIYMLAGKEGLIENGNWYIIFKEKEPEMQIGG